MTHRLTALIPFLLLVGFLGIMVVAIARLDLTLLVLGALALTAWDVLGPHRPD